MRCIFLSLILFLLTAFTSAAEPHQQDKLRLRGYIKLMPGLQLDKDFSDPAFNQLLHHRLNVRWDITDNVDLRIEGRNRLMYNELFDGVPGLKELFEQDAGLVDMSWVWLADGSWIGHSEVDRLYLSWRTDNWRVRMGRQRVNWGINLVSNPNDLFNTYSFFDFDYEERPGADALRVQHFLGRLSSIELAVSPARSDRNTVAAIKYAHNWRAYDIQLISGYFRDRLALGGGWAGHLGGAGFKGEATWFYDLEKQSGSSRGNMVAAAGLDYMFPRGTFAILEFLYNGGYQRVAGSDDPTLMITEPLRPDNIMFSEFAITLSADKVFSPLVSGGVAFMVLPDIEAAFVMPRFSYSLGTNLDFELVAQIFAGGEETIFEEAGSRFFGVLKYAM